MEDENTTTDANRVLEKEADGARSDTDQRVEASPRPRRIFEEIRFTDYAEI